MNLYFTKQNEANSISFAPFITSILTHIHRDTLFSAGIGVLKALHGSCQCSDKMSSSCYIPKGQLYYYYNL